MLDLIHTVLWLLVAAFAVLCLLVMFLLPLLQREHGPWVVYRVAAEGSGTIEFRALVGPMEWVSALRMAYFWSSQTAAELEANRFLADVAPLSRFLKEGE